MSTSKSGGSTRLGRDSQPKYLGIKCYDGEFVQEGNIIVKQRGTKFHPGTNVRMGNDYTLYAVHPGSVKFTHKRKNTFAGKQRKVTLVNVYSE